MSQNFADVSLGSNSMVYHAQNSSGEEGDFEEMPDRFGFNAFYPNQNDLSDIEEQQAEILLEDEALPAQLIPPLAYLENISPQISTNQLQTKSSHKKKKSSKNYSQYLIPHKTQEVTASVIVPDKVLKKLQVREYSPVNMEARTHQTVVSIDKQTKQISTWINSGDDKVLHLQYGINVLKKFDQLKESSDNCSSKVVLHDMSIQYEQQEDKAKESFWDTVENSATEPHLEEQKDLLDSNIKQLRSKIESTFKEIELN